MKEDKLIVGVFGAQCTGKTTFIHDVVNNSVQRTDEQYRWKLFGRNYRDVINEKGLKINRDGNEECQIVIHDVLLSNIIDAINENESKRLIMDRTIIDSFAYTFWHFAYGNGNVNPKLLEEMWNQVCRYAKTFNSLIYIPLEKCSDVVIIDDKFRDTNQEYRKQIDKIMKSIWFTLCDEGCNMQVVYGPREERVKIFFNSMEYMMENSAIGRFSSIKEFSARTLLP